MILQTDSCSYICSRRKEGLAAALAREHKINTCTRCVVGEPREGRSREIFIRGREEIMRTRHFIAMIGPERSWKDPMQDARKIKGKGEVQA